MRYQFSAPPAIGFVLVELLIVLALLTLFATAAAPTFSEWLARTRVETQAQALLTTLGFARSEAIKRGVRITVCRDDGGQRCGAGAVRGCRAGAAKNDWTCGYLVLIDSSASANERDGAQILRLQPPAQGVVIKGAAARLSFTPPAGQIIGGLRSLEIAARTAMRSVRAGELYRCVRIAAGGRARIINGPCKKSK